MLARLPVAAVSEPSNFDALTCGVASRWTWFGMITHAWA
jgi:hypothetical protein